MLFLCVELAQGERVCAHRNGVARAEFRNSDADALLGVVSHVTVGSVDLQRALIAFGELLELLFAVQIVNLHLHAVQLVARDGVHLAAQLFEQAGHDPFAGARDAAADDDEPVHQRHGRCHGVAGDLAQLGEG